MTEADRAFGTSRLLSFDRDPRTGTPTVEVAHEALLREWARLAAVDRRRAGGRAHAPPARGCGARMGGIRAAIGSFLAARGPPRRSSSPGAASRGLPSPSWSAGTLATSIEEREAAEVAEEARRARESVLERRSAEPTAGARRHVCRCCSRRRRSDDLRLPRERTLEARGEDRHRQRIDRGLCRRTSTSTRSGASCWRSGQSRRSARLRTPCLASPSRRFTAPSSRRARLTSSRARRPAAACGEPGRKARGDPGHGDSGAALWDARTGKKVGTLSQPGYAVEFSPDGLASSDRGARTERSLGTCAAAENSSRSRTRPGGGHEGQPRRRILATASPTEPQDLELRTGRGWTAAGGLCGQLSFSPDGHQVAAAGCFGAGRQSHRVGRRRARRFSVWPKSFGSCSMSRSARTGGASRPSARREGKVWDRSHGRLLATLVGHTGVGHRGHVQPRRRAYRHRRGRRHGEDLERGDRAAATCPSKATQGGS